MDIYVGNLSYSCTDDDLRQFFAQFGAVASARVITDRETGRSRGFGFVSMPDRTEAQAALDGANGADLMGRPLRVNESQPRAPRAPGGGGGDRRDRGDDRRDRGGERPW
jgi:RNA recognition motif-containing protein